MVKHECTICGVLLAAGQGHESESGGGVILRCDACQQSFLKYSRKKKIKVPQRAHRLLPPPLFFAPAAFVMWALVLGGVSFAVLCGRAHLAGGVAEGEHLAVQLLVYAHACARFT
jgi:hypothetical protein